jgi:hypothetical protein
MSSAKGAMAIPVSTRRSRPGLHVAAENRSEHQQIESANQVVIWSASMRTRARHGYTSLQIAWLQKRAEQ